MPRAPAKSKTTKKAGPARSPARKTAGASLYSVHPGVAMVAKWAEELPAKTGRSLEEWLAHIAAEGPDSQAERREWLKRVHGFGTNTAWWLAERAENKATWDGDPESYLRAAPRYVEEMYAGKMGLRPLHDRLIELSRALGEDVKICPCQTIVPLYRQHVFAQIKPSTRTRLDFGLALAKHKGKLPARLIDTGGLAKKDRITHRIGLTSLEEIDTLVERWLRVAYELDV